MNATTYLGLNPKAKQLATTIWQGGDMTAIAEFLGSPDKQKALFDFSRRVDETEAAGVADEIARKFPKLADAWQDRLETDRTYPDFVNALRQNPQVGELMPTSMMNTLKTSPAARREFRIVDDLDVEKGILAERIKAPDFVNARQRATEMSNAGIKPEKITEALGIMFPKLTPEQHGAVMTGLQTEEVKREADIAAKLKVDVPALTGAGYDQALAERVVAENAVGVKQEGKELAAERKSKRSVNILGTSLLRQTPDILKMINAGPIGSRGLWTQVIGGAVRGTVEPLTPVTGTTDADLKKAAAIRVVLANYLRKYNQFLSAVGMEETRESRWRDTQLADLLSNDGINRLSQNLPALKGAFETLTKLIEDDMELVEEHGISVVK